MPSPVAHVGAAWALVLALAPPGARPSGRVLAAAAAASVAPDLDLLAAVVLPGALAWHRGPTHSLLGATLLGLAMAAAAGPGARPRHAVVLAAALHPVFDWSTGEPGAPARYGVPWAWPFREGRAIDPDPWFGAFHIDTDGFLANMWAARALPVYLREVGTAAALLGLAALVRALRRRWQGLPSVPRLREGSPPSGTPGPR